ncbi:MAG: hypothetical protein RLZZ436_206 [Planctomycetota bacterium]|jgi:uncharacterized protein YdhG (YjbR/CyaY superfamily)
MSVLNGSQETDAWISQFPTSTQKLLNQIRITVTRAVPQAEEVIRYGIPTLRLRQNLLHYAAFENHIGLYPTPSAMRHFADELKGYVQGKGSVQFPLDQPLPLKLIGEITKFRAAEVAGAEQKKPGKRSAKKGSSQ